MTWLRWPTLVLAAVLFTVAVQAREAEALDVTVKVTIERIIAQDCVDEIDLLFDTICDPIWGEADFYAVVSINGTEFDNKNTPDQDANEQDDDISPNWEFSKGVDVSLASIPVQIRIFDEDGFLRGDDDPVDVQAGGNDDLDLTVTLVPCSVGGELSGACSTTLISTGDSGNDDAELRFRIEVQEPPSAPGLRVQCMHSPLFPQPGENVTIMANALDGTLAAKVADNIQIWVDDQSGPDASIGGTTLTFVTAPVAAPSFSYGCRVSDDGVPIFTGWRKVSVGDPADSGAIPVLFTGPRSSRLDIVLIADEDSYTGDTDSTFLTDAGNVILQAYYGYDLYLSNQDKFNFWLAKGTGNAERAEDGCDHEPPDGWDDEYAFADVGAILHTDTFRDCAPDRLFSSEPTSIRTVRHETGHKPFGLADEYCCDGGYFQTDVFPNIYEEPDDCADDAPSLGRTGSDCREFEETIDWWFDPDWSVSDPGANDLMVDNTTAQANDLRRINWVYGNCASAGC